MAIYKCSECGASISEYANACPRCGALGSGERSKKIANSGGGVVGVFVVGAIAFGAYYFATNKRNDSGYDSGYSPSRSANTEQSENGAVGNEQSQPASEVVEGSNASSSSEVASEAVYVCCYGAFSGEERPSL
ncbi:MAG: zinc-ribbon domain-containing protein [Ignavibacteria bacterium]|nr:zinc-ribbon domain-containing protein [Ignavibacteria bacterium]